MRNYELTSTPEGADFLDGLDELLGGIEFINETVLMLDNKSDKTGLPPKKKPAKTPKGTKPNPPKRPAGK